jgi:sirohydrochlorin cobaltochelatase
MNPWGRSHSLQRKIITAIVMVGRGSRDPCAQADLKVLCRCVATLRPVRKVLPSFYAMAEPALPAALAQAANDPQVRDVIVQPHLLFDGAIFNAIGRAVQEAQKEYPRCRLRCSGFLGTEPELVDALLQRVFGRRSGFGRRYATSNA